MALRSSACLLALVAASSACDVEPIAVGTGGVDADHGLVALLGDYTSVQIALLAEDGSVQSPSFLSSGSAPTSGLAFAFSGDTVLPSSPMASGEIVLIDRFGTNVLSWANPRTAEVRTQLAVGTGFESNPRDYLELGPRKAYVSRFGEDPLPGSEPFDGGGDLLIIDPATPEITGRIALPLEGELPPRPSGMTLHGSTALLILQRISRDFASTGESRLVGVSTTSDEIVWQIPVVGFKGCGKPALSPSAARLVLACTGDIDTSGRLRDPSETGIVVFDAALAPPVELTRFTYAELGSSVQSEIAFAGEHTILVKTQTAVGDEADNALFVLDLESGDTRTLAVATPDELGRGRGLTYGGVYCDPARAKLCMLADADVGAIRRFDLTADLAEIAPVTIGGSGLSPLDIQAY